MRPIPSLRRAAAPLLGACLTLAACADAPTAPAASASIFSQVDIDPAALLAWDEWESVSAGGSHSCALTASGRVYCWGSNADGQLGSAGGDALRPRAIDVSALPAGLRFQQVSAGEYNSCALSSASSDWGYAYCWGLGIGATPTAVPYGFSFSTLSAGATKACGLTPIGNIICWPFGGSPGAVHSSPTGVRFRSISLAWDHACAIESDVGDAYCWGENDFFQAGYASTTTTIAQPRRVPGTGYTSLDAGSFFTCGVMAGQAPWYEAGAHCWGWGLNGRLGSDVFGRYVPTPITDPARRLLDSVSAGRAHACGIEVMLNRHGYVWCWGDNRLGQMGVGIAPTLPSSWRPMRIVSGSVYSQVSAGAEHSCALTRYRQFNNVSGATPGRAEIHCWGRNTRGQLGNLTTTTSGYPVKAIHPQVIAVVDLNP